MAKSMRERIFGSLNLEATGQRVYFPDPSTDHYEILPAWNQTTVNLTIEFDRREGETLYQVLTEMSKIILETRDRVTEED